MANLALKVAILHYAAPPGIGGVEVTLHHHARVLTAAGHQVRTLAGSGQPEHLSGELLVNPLFGSRGPEIEAVNQQLAAGEAGSNFHKLVDRITPLLAAALADVDVALVHNIISLHKNLALTAALRRLHDSGRGPRLLAWCHDFAWHDPLYQPELHPGWPWQLLQEPWPGVRYVAVSQDRRAILAEILGLPANQIAVVTPGVDLATCYKLEADTLALIDQYRLLQADPLLLLPARITRRKNIELAIAVAGALQQRGLAPRLLITGPPGPHNPTNAAYLAQLESLRADSGAEDAVLFLYRAYTHKGAPRPISNAMLADLYHLADGLFFPSRSEGFGIPMLEAALAGLPIFCSDIPPFREIAGSAATYFKPHDDPHIIAGQLEHYYRGSPAYQLRRHTRLHTTWEAIYQTTIVPLLQEEERYD